MAVFEELKKRIDKRKAESDMRKQEKNEKKAQENIFKNQLKLLSLRGVDTRGIDDIETLNLQLLTVAHRDKSILEEIHLLPEQASNLDFMMELYKCGNLFFTSTHIPRTDNLEYLMEYLKILNNPMFRDRDIPYRGLRNILKYIPHSIYNNQAFVEALIQNFPNENVLEALKTRLGHIHTMPRSLGLKEFDKLVHELSTETLTPQVRTLGHNAMQFIPRDREDYIDLVGTSIECDDFTSLSLLTPQQLINHKDYIGKAFESAKARDSLNYPKVKNYFHHALSPIQHTFDSDIGSSYYFSSPHLLASYNIARDKNLWDNIDIPNSMKESILKGLEHSLSAYTLPDVPTDIVEETSTAIEETPTNN